MIDGLGRGRCPSRVLRRCRAETMVHPGMLIHPVLLLLLLLTTLLLLLLLLFPAVACTYHFLRKELMEMGRVVAEARWREELERASEPCPASCLPVPASTAHPPLSLSHLLAVARPSSQGAKGPERMIEFLGCRAWKGAAQREPGPDLEPSLLPSPFISPSLSSPWRTSSSRAAVVHVL